MKQANDLTPILVLPDIHGCASLLNQALYPHLGSGAEIIFLGDLVDRAPEPDGDRMVIEIVRDLQENPEVYGLGKTTVLRGNHEALLLDALREGGNGPATRLWLHNGGDRDFLPLAKQHRDWLEALPVLAIRGKYLFVHAGVRPGVPLEGQSSDDLLWIREPFLSQDHDLPYVVVHGHSFKPDFEIDVLPHRIGLDTGAFRSGRLEAYPLTV